MVSKRLAMLIAGLVLAIAIGAATGGASTKRAAMVNGCTRGACIDAYTGGKNTANHTQWLDTVEVYYGGGTHKIEAWGDGFYRVSSSSTSSRWYIGRWVRSGTYVCGAITYSGGDRAIACIAIRV